MGDLRKESIPYVVGQHLTIRSHCPPPPLPKNDPRAYSSGWDESFSSIKLCLENPPRPGLDGKEFASIKIVKELHAGSDKKAQLLVIKVVDSSQSLHLPVDQNIVAKFYDPFYHDDAFRGEDPFFTVDYEYSHECAAYNHLSELHGSVIPRCFGSFSLKIPADGSLHVVRLILIEWIDGFSMDKLDPKKYSREERQEIMKKIVDAESSLYTKDVLHEDLYPRNVMIEGQDTRTCRVVLIDLGCSVIGRCRNPRIDPQRFLPGTPISPLLRWNARFRHQTLFYKWIDWPWQSWLEVEYKDTESTITEDLRKIWPIDEEGN
jgi:serine/threonine protein kinase